MTEYGPSSDLFWQLVSDWITVDDGPNSTGADVCFTGCGFGSGAGRYRGNGYGQGAATACGNESGTGLGSGAGHAGGMVVGWGNGYGYQHPTHGGKDACNPVGIGNGSGTSTGSGDPDGTGGPE